MIPVVGEHLNCSIFETEIQVGRKPTSGIWGLKHRKKCPLVSVPGLVLQHLCLLRVGGLGRAVRKASTFPLLVRHKEQPDRLLLSHCPHRPLHPLFFFFFSVAQHQDNLFVSLKEWSKQVTFQSICCAGAARALSAAVPRLCCRKEQ